MRRRYRVQPSKGALVMSAVIGAVFTCIGVFVLIPATWKLGPFALFGLLWTGIAVYTAVSSLLVLLGKKNVTGYSGMEIYEETEEEAVSAAASTAEDRLQELRNLYDRSLITEEEYEAKRREILKEL